MNVEKIKAALYALIEALEDEGAPAPKPAPPKPKKSRRGAALRVFTPSAPLTERGIERAREIMKRKGLL